MRRDRGRCGRGRHDRRTGRRETPGWHGMQIICGITAPKACWLWRWKLEKFSLRMWQDFHGCVRLPRYEETPRLSFLPRGENNDGEEKTGRTGANCKCSIQPWDPPTIAWNRKGEDDHCVLCSLELQKKEVCKREGCNQFAQNVVRMGIACIMHDATTPAQREIYNPRQEGATRTARGGGNWTCEKCARERTASPEWLPWALFASCDACAEEKKWRKCNDKSCGSYAQSGCDGHCFNQHATPCTEGGKNNRKRRAAKK